jgi:hypothetical protein
MKRLLFLLGVCALSALAADISGTWKGTAEGPNGSIERTFVFKVDGNKLTGETTSQMMGKSTITDGKVEGDNLSFSITAKFQDTDVKLSYKGKVTGNEIHLTSSMAGGDGGLTLEWHAKKVE